MGLNAFQANAGQFNTGTPGGGGGTDERGLITYTDTRKIPYTLELHEADGNHVWTLPDWYGGQYTEKPNAAWPLTFNYRGDDDRADTFTTGREIWLWEGDTVEPKQKFLITNVNDIESTGRNINVTAKSLIHSLTFEHVGTYEQTSPTAISTVVNALLAFQMRDNTISIGEIDPAIGAQTWTGKFEIKSVWACLTDLQSKLGGYMTVGTDRKLSWKREIGVMGRFDIRVGRNCNLIQRNTNSEGMANRIIAYGAGYGQARRLTVTVNDAASQSTYGIFPAPLSLSTVNNITELTAAANAELNRRSTPRVTYDVGCADLSKTDSDLDFSFDANTLTLGTKINLLSSLMAVDIETRIQSITRQLDSPMNVKIHVSNPEAGTAAWGKNDPMNSRRRNIADLFVDLMKEQNDARGDTGTIETLKEMASETYGTNDDADDWQDALIDAIAEVLEFAVTSNPQAHPRYNRIRNALGGVASNDLTYQDAALEGDTAAINEGDASGETTVADFKTALEGLLSTGSGGSIGAIYEAANFGALPSTDIESFALGRTTDNGFWYKRNVANNAWILLVVWEAAP